MCSGWIMCMTDGWTHTQTKEGMDRRIADGGNSGKRRVEGTIGKQIKVMDKLIKESSWGRGVCILPLSLVLKERNWV